MINNESEEFNFQAIIEKIEHCLATGKGDEAMLEIRRPWPGMNIDIGIAAHELIDELTRTGKVSLLMKSMEFDDMHETVAIQFPDWFIATNQAFDQRYPNPQEASLRFQKTMAVLQHELLFARNSVKLRFEDLLEVLQTLLPEDWPNYRRARLH